jgi:hypothetical protein
MSSTVGEESDRPAITTASMAVPLVDSPIVQRSAASAVVVRSSDATTQPMTGRTRGILAARRGTLDK